MRDQSQQAKASNGQSAPVTVRDLARVAGVSIGTVDRVLHNRGRVSQATRARVQAAVRALGYTTNVVASNLSRARRTRFAVVLPQLDQDGGYRRQAAAGIERALRELAHHYVDVEFLYYDRHSATALDGTIAALRAAGPDGVLLAPTITAGSHRLIESLEGLPCVLFDGELPGAPVISTVAQDSFQSGLMAGKLLHLLGGSGRFISVTHGEFDYHLRRRSEGCAAYFAGCAECSLEVANVDSVEGWKTVRRAWNSVDGAPVGVFVTNAMAHRLVPYLPEHPRPAVVGFDLIPENAALLAAGRIDFIINQDPGRQAYRGVYALYRHVVLHEAVEPRIRMPIEIVMRENLDAYQTDASKD